MKTLPRSDIPEDFIYYRTGSRVFFDYLKRFLSYITERVGKRGEFFSAFQMFPGFWSITAEKIDYELTRQEFEKCGIRHGIVWWTPMRKTEKPRGWWRTPTWWTKYDIHASRTAFSVLDRPDYASKWSSSARAHRRKVLEHIETWKITIRDDATLDEFLELYERTPVRDSEKWFRLRLTRKLFEKTDTDYRIYIISVDGKPLAWALFIDEGTTSEYWVSFYHADGHPYHLGIAMMDRWMFDSYKKWIKYCDLDHMRDNWQSLGYAGYTKFKSSIADYDVYFHDMWVKIF